MVLGLDIRKIKVLQILLIVFEQEMLKLNLNMMVFTVKFYKMKRVIA